MKPYIGAFIMFVSASWMGVALIASSLELVTPGYGALAALLAGGTGWAGAALVGSA